MNTTKDLAWLVITALMILCLMPTWNVHADPNIDSDGDGTRDGVDNCRAHVNPGQVNTDTDSYGNRCDGDFNNDGYINAIDISLFFNCLTVPNPSPDCDLNEDGYVNAFEIGLFRNMLLSGQGPGPGPLCTVIGPPPATIGPASSTTQNPELVWDDVPGASPAHYFLEMRCPFDHPTHGYTLWASGATCDGAECRYTPASPVHEYGWCAWRVKVHRMAPVGCVSPDPGPWGDFFVNVPH